MKFSMDSRGGRFEERPLTAAVEADLDPVAEEEAPEEESAAERWDKLAREIEEEIEQEPAPVVASVPRRRRRSNGKFATLIASIQAMSQQSNTALMTAIAAMADEDEEDEYPAQTIEVHNHLPAHQLSVRVDPPQVAAPNVTVEPARVEPHFTVEAPKAPDVHVDVAPPEVHVAAPPAPNVELRPEIRVEAPNVEVATPDIHVTVEQPRPNAVRATKEDDGSTVFTVEEAEEE